MIVVKVGKELNLGRPTWRGYVSGYFESEKHAEKYLIERGYEKDHDGIFFKDIDMESTDIAIVTNFERIEVNI